MAEFRWIKTSLLLILGLQFTATLQQYTSFIVRVGDEVTLPRRPHDTTKDQDKCDGTTWSFRSRYSEGDLVFHGKINENTKSDRLSVTANCSLVIKKVTAEDAGQYMCQHKSRTNEVYLSVVTMTKHQDTDEVTLNCSVSPYRECEHTVEWLNEDEDNLEMMTPQSDCSASVTTSLSESKSHECEVTDNFSGNTKQFIYLDSDEKTGENEKTSTSKPTTTTKTTTATTTTTTTTATKPKSPVTDNTISKDNNTQAQGQGWWWWFIILPVVLAALLVVVLIRWKRAKGTKTQVDANTADPEDGVSYASVSFTKTTNSKARVQGNVGDDEGDAVTYSTVKASSSA